MQGGDEVEGAGSVGEAPVDVAREVPQVRKLERERQFGRRDAGAVRAERRQDALDGESVLVEVFRARREFERGGRVGVGVGAARVAASEDARGHVAVVDAHEGLGARAEVPVDGERPGVGVAEGQLEQHAAQVSALGNVTHEVASEHDLAHASGRAIRSTAAATAAR